MDRMWACPLQYVLMVFVNPKSCFCSLSSRRVRTDDVQARPEVPVIPVTGQKENSASPLTKKTAKKHGVGGGRRHVGGD